MRIICIQNPLTQRVEEDIGSQAGGEHHGTPNKGRILRLFVRFPQTDGTVGREGQIDRQQKKAKSHSQIPDAELIAQEGPDRIQRLSGAFRCGEKAAAQKQDNGEGRAIGIQSS